LPLLHTHYPTVSKIVPVPDNLNTHKPASLHEAFPAEEARRLVERFEWHDTPKDGSWSACRCPSASIAASPTSLLGISM